MPDLYKLPSNDYHDITQGSNGYSAGAGYDLATGLGTPIASRVVGDLWGQSPPKANNDSYTVSANTTLNVSASNGVLANDTDPMGEPLIAATFTQPANGSVTVYQDGSFTYKPKNSFSGTDSFTYTILDTGTGVGSTATVQITVNQALPDLAPYTPSGWSGPLVVSTQSSNTTTATTITTANTVYIDWAFLNQGNASITTAFQTELLLDGKQVTTWSTGAPLNPTIYIYVKDYSLGQLAAGSHTVTVVADYLNQVTESNKNNNTISDTFTVTQAALPDLAPYTPSGWSGPLVVSTQSGNTTTASSITTANNIYIDWAFINQGNATITTTFHTELLVDGVQVHTWFTNPPLGPTIYTFVQNFSLGQLAAGNHTITVVADYLNEVTESNENNDTATYTFTVTKPAPTLALPTATTQPATAISATGATLNASVNPEGNAATVSFVYGTSPSLSTGTTTTTAQSIGGGTSAVPVTAPLTGLTPNTTYYFEVTATNAGGTTTGSILSFTTAVTVPLVASVTIVPSVASPTYGQALTFTATVSPASSGGPTPGGTVQFQVDGVNLGQAVTLVKGAATSIATSTLGAGNHTVTAVFSGNNTYAGNSKNRGLTVAKAHLTVSAVAKSKVYGAAVPTLAATFSGFVNGDTAKVVSGAAKLTTTATASSGVGTYPITIAKGTLSAANYDFPKLVNGTLTVTKAQLTVTAVN